MSSSDLGDSDRPVVSTTELNEKREEVVDMIAVVSSAEERQRVGESSTVGRRRTLHLCSRTVSCCCYF